MIYPIGCCLAQTGANIRDFAIANTWCSRRFIQSLDTKIDSYIQLLLCDASIDSPVQLLPRPLFVDCLSASRNSTS